LAPAGGAVGSLILVLGIYHLHQDVAAADRISHPLLLFFAVIYSKLSATDRICRRNPWFLQALQEK
jgi:hypothetical protein